MQKKKKLFINENCAKITIKMDVTNPLGSIIKYDVKFYFNTLKGKITKRKFAL